MVSSHLKNKVSALKRSHSRLTNAEHTSAPRQVSGAGALIFKLLLALFTIYSSVFKNPDG